MATIPSVPSDHVIYDIKDLYIRHDLDIFTLDGSEIRINGHPITLLDLDGQRGEILVEDGGDTWRLNKLCEEQYTVQNGSANYQVMVGDRVSWFDEKGIFFVGKNLLANMGGSGHARVADFAIDVAGPGRVFCRSLSMATVNDPCDINLRRFGGNAPYGAGAEDGTIDDLTGLGVGGLIGQLRATGASSPNRGVLNKVVTNAVNNGAGLIRITCAAHGLSTSVNGSDRIWMSGVVGTTEANGFWLVTVIDVNTFDLQGSVFTNAYVSGGVFDVTGAIASSTGATISFVMSDMPRRVTSDGQTSNAMALEVNLAPRHSHDFRETVFRISSKGNVQMGKQACFTGDLGDLFQLKAYAGLNNKQTLTILNSPNNGTFDIRYYSNPTTDTNYAIEVNTAPIARNASPTAVRDALVAALITIPGLIGQTANLYSAVTSADILVTGAGNLPDNVLTIEFTGILGKMAKYRMLGTNINMTGAGATPTITIARLGQAGIEGETGKRLFDWQHCVGQTADYGRIRDGAGLNALTLDVDRKLHIGTTVRLAEMAAPPAAPPVNTAEIYIEDNGSGKTRAMILFATGAAQQLAIQP